MLSCWWWTQPLNSSFFRYNVKLRTHVNLTTKSFMFGLGMNTRWNLNETINNQLINCEPFFFIYFSFSSNHLVHWAVKWFTTIIFFLRITSNVDIGQAWRTSNGVYWPFWLNANVHPNEKSHSNREWHCHSDSIIIVLIIFFLYRFFDRA